jgi:glutathione peroxidase
MPCNQFGLQENSSEAELMNAIKYVRPGGGFEPNFPIFGMVKCNGEEKHPLYAAMYKALPDTPKPEHGYLCKTSPKQLLLAEIPDGEVAWNFEKFLIDKSGVPVKRYVPFTKPEDIDADIAALLK